MLCTFRLLYSHKADILSMRKFKILFTCICTVFLLWNLNGYFTNDLYHLNNYHKSTPDCNSRHIIVGHQTGGTGNLLFSFAAVLNLAQALNMTPFLGTKLCPLRKIFHITIPCRPPKGIFKFVNLCGWDISKTFIAFNNLKSNRNNFTIFGFFFSPKFFENVTEKVKDQLAFHAYIRDKAATYVNKQASVHNANTTVGIHVRGGDHNTSSYIKNGLGAPPVSYYRNAIRYFNNATKYGVVLFIVCTMERKWAQTHLQGEHLVISKHTAEIELAILASTDHVIIGTGTFAWWGAWLGRGKVIRYENYPRPNSRGSGLISSDWYYPKSDRWISLGESGQ